MINFLCTSSFFKNRWVAMETGRFHIAQTGISLWDKNVRIKFVQVNELVPMKHCPGGGVQDRSN